MAPCCPLGARLLFFPGGRKNLSCRAHPMGHPGRWIFFPGEEHSFVCNAVATKGTRSVPGMSSGLAGVYGIGSWSEPPSVALKENFMDGTSVQIFFWRTMFRACRERLTSPGTNTSVSVLSRGCGRSRAFGTPGQICFVTFWTGLPLRRARGRIRGLAEESPGRVGALAPGR